MASEIDDSAPRTGAAAGLLAPAITPAGGGVQLVRSVPGEGSTFLLTLPLSRS